MRTIQPLVFFATLILPAFAIPAEFFITHKPLSEDDIFPEKNERSDMESMYKSSFVISGRIKNGDYEKFRDIVLKYPKINMVYLLSPGGDVQESIDIGKLVRKTKMFTNAPGSTSSDKKLPVLTPGVKQVQKLSGNYIPDKNKTCSSSCFLIWSAGVVRLGGVKAGIRTQDETFAYSDDKGYLGIHRPRMPSSWYKDSSAGRAISRSKKTRVYVSKYLKDMGVPEKIEQKMFSVSSGDMFFLKNNSVISMHGIISPLKNWLRSQCESFYKDAPKERWEFRYDLCWPSKLQKAHIKAVRDM